MKVDGMHTFYSMAKARVDVARPQPKADVTRITPAERPAGQADSKGGVPPEKVEQAVKQINDYLQSVQRNLQFSVDQDTNQIVVKVVDAKTGEVVRQIPPESALEIARNMARMKKPDQGLLLAQRA